MIFSLEPKEISAFLSYYPATEVFSFHARIKPIISMLAIRISGKSFI